MAFASGDKIIIAFPIFIFASLFIGFTKFT